MAFTYTCAQEEAVILSRWGWPLTGRTLLADAILRSRYQPPNSWLRRALRFRVRVA